MSAITLNKDKNEGRQVLPHAGSKANQIDRFLDGILQKSALNPLQLAKDNSVSDEGMLLAIRFDFKIIVSQISMHLARERRLRLFAQIDSLLDPEEWDFSDKLPSEESFKTFVRMLLLLTPNRLPGIGISSFGHIVAAWTNNKDRLTIDCLSGDRIRWVLTRCDGLNVERAAGECAIDRLKSVLVPYRPDVWFEDAK